jgi:UDP-N-acetylglucosamine 2-epimerase (non-hydrolysing)
MKTVMTVSGIRPDFIRMSAIFKELDKEFNHILVHTGQHYDKLLSDVFFDELEIRKPDYVLETGKNGGTHYHQLSYLSTAILELIKNENLKPDIIIFLGDSNTVCAALPLRKEGYIIGHVEAGMRSFDKRMLEEINRTVCDHCSHVLFVYHDEYKKYLENENIKNNVHVVGNTIVEVCKPFIPNEPKKMDMILVDIHRPENFKYKHRMENIILYANECSTKYNLPVKMLRFHGTCKCLEEYNINLGSVELVDLMPYKKYLTTIYHCKFIISDSGTGQEEPALFETPVIVPRDYTERPQSVESNCSFMINVNDLSNKEESFIYLENILNGHLKIDTKWLGSGNTSKMVIEQLKNFFSDNCHVIKHITNKLSSINKNAYNNIVPYPHCSLDDILPDDFAIKCKDEILNIPHDCWDRYDNPFEQKFTLRNKDNLPTHCKQLFDILTSEKVISILSDITGEKMINDPNKNWWGIHTYENGDYLDIHSDAGNHPITKQKKHITLGIYLSHNWKEENSGHLEIWDGDSVLKDDALISKLHTRILPTFNRLIMFTNTVNAWHGNPDPVKIYNDEKRIFLTLSYLSEKHSEGMENNREKAFFVNRPNDEINEEKEKLRFIRADPDKCKNIYKHH